MLVEGGWGRRGLGGATSRGADGKGRWGWWTCTANGGTPGRRVEARETQYAAKRMTHQEGTARTSHARSRRARDGGLHVRYGQLRKVVVLRGLNSVPMESGNESGMKYGRRGKNSFEAGERVPSMLHEYAAIVDPGQPKAQGRPRHSEHVDACPPLSHTHSSPRPFVALTGTQGPDTKRSLEHLRAPTSSRTRGGSRNSRGCRIECASGTQGQQWNPRGDARGQARATRPQDPIHLGGLEAGEAWGICHRPHRGCGFGAVGLGPIFPVRSGPYGPLDCLSGAARQRRTSHTAYAQPMSP